MARKILIVEDEVAIAELIRINLKHEGYETLIAKNALQAEGLIKAELPSLLILDWMLPGTNGTAFSKRLRSNNRTRNIPIIMLTARTSEQDKVEGLDHGADDYVTKPFSPRELIARIRALLRRRTPELTDDSVSIDGLTIEPSTHQVKSKDANISLGPKEFKLLHYFMTHMDRVHSRTHLLDQVWGDHVFVEERTVDVHIRRLRKSLEPSNHNSKIKTVRGSGYKFTSHTRAKND